MTATTQQQQALATANERRLGIATFKRDTRLLGTRGAADRVATVIETEHDDPTLGAARIRHLLLCVPRLGEQKAAKCMSVAGVMNFDKRLRDLTPRQRTALSLQLRLWIARWGERSA